MRSPGKLYATVLFLRLKRAILLSACNKVLVILKPDYQKNDLVNNTSPDHPLPFSGWWALLVWAIVLTFISARGYVKTLGVICFAAIILAFVLPIAGYSGSWGVLATLLCFATPFPGRSYRFHAFRQKRCVIQCVAPTDRHVTKEATRPPDILHHRHLPLHPLSTMTISAVVAVHPAVAARQEDGKT